MAKGIKISKGALFNEKGNIVPSARQQVLKALDKRVKDIENYNLGEYLNPTDKLGKYEIALHDKETHEIIGYVRVEMTVSDKPFSALSTKSSKPKADSETIEIE